MDIGKLIGIILIAGAIATFIFFAWNFCNESMIDRQVICIYTMCSLPPLGGLAGGIACLAEKKFAKRMK